MALGLHPRRLQYRLAALFWLALVAALGSLWWVQRQRRIERNARLDEIALRAKRLRDFVPFLERNRWLEFHREEVATRWLMEIARQKGSRDEELAALQGSAARLKRMAANVRILERAGSVGGAEQDVTLVKSRQAQTEVALAQRQGNASKIRELLAKYVRCLREYRDAILKESRNEAGGVVLAEIDLAGARVVQAEWNRDWQAQIAALREQMAAVQTLARVLLKDESNALGVTAADYAAARIRAKLARLMQDEAGEISSWQQALTQLRKLHEAERSFLQNARDDRRWTGGEIDFAMRLPQPNLLLDVKAPEPLAAQAKMLKRAALEELVAVCRVGREVYASRQSSPRGPQTAARKKDNPAYDPYWDALQALAENQFANAGGSPE